VSKVDPSIDVLRAAAAKALADDFSIDLAKRPSPEPEIAIACARDAAKAWVRWVHRT
jgi:hypothetical protein